MVYDLCRWLTKGHSGALSGMSALAFDIRSPLKSFWAKPAQYDLDALVLAARAFVRPRDVTKDEDLTVFEKRRILASWAPDPCVGLGVAAAAQSRAAHDRPTRCSMRRDRSWSG
jgi:hypothetical protein